MSSIKRMKTLGVSGFIGVGLICAAASPALAQESVDMTQLVTADQVVKSDKEESLDPTVSINASTALTQNKDVVGAIDGFSTLFSLGISGGLEYINGAHSWNNTLTIDESWARTPALDQFVKNNDQLEFESLYNYFLLDWFGPFGRVALTTAIFDTEIVTADPQTYEFARLDGSTDARTVTNLKLAESLEPLTLSQSLGVFAEPIRTKPLRWKIRVGAGGRETFAKGVLAINDDGDTDIIEGVELDNVYQAGVEGFTGAEGKFDGGRITYAAGATALVPFINNDDQDRSAIDLLRWGLKADVTVAVTEWMGLNYGLKILNDPQLLDAVQVQNNLLLTFKYTLIEPVDPTLTPAEQADEYRKKAQEAEEDAAEFREKALQEDMKAQEKEDAEGAARDAESKKALQAAQAERDAMAAQAAAAKEEAAKAQAEAAKKEAAIAEAKAEEAEKKAEAQDAEADSDDGADAEAPVGSDDSAQNAPAQTP